jgi:1-acyl-sn-glycerol-3-phosphate acyltransferase
MRLIGQFLCRAWGAAAVLMALLYTAVLAVFAAITAPFWHGKAVSFIAWLWSKLILGTCGIKVELEGLEHLDSLKSFVIVTNHQSVLDIFALFAALPYELRFIAKKELFKIPLIGFAMHRSGHILIDRVAGGQAIRHALKIVRRGNPIVFFAEGHRYADNQVHPFHNGAAWLAILGKLPCIPAAICGSGELFPPGAWTVKPFGRIRIKLCPAIPTADLKPSQRDQLTQQLENAVRAAFIEQLTAGC